MRDGPIYDLDSHLQMSSEQLEAVFGREASRLRTAIDGPSRPSGRPRSAGTFDPAAVWTLKGVNAYGASDAGERLQVLGAMGIGRQLVLPRVRVAHAAWNSPRGPGLSLARRFNEFIADWQACDRAALYGVGILTMHDPKGSLEIVDAARRLGLRAMLIPCFAPPGGCSPASGAWDGVWRRLAESGLAVILHAGSEKDFVDRRWTPPAHPGTTEMAADARMKIDVETTDLFKLVTNSYAPEIYLSSLVIGGVLDRYRSLRIAVVELGAAWAEPFISRLQSRLREFDARASAGHGRDVVDVFLDQVRFTPFHWEDLSAMLGRADLYRLYAFSTDFPHLEGGQQALEVADAATAGLGGAVRSSYFSEGARLILQG